MLNFAVSPFSRPCAHVIHALTYLAMQPPRKLCGAAEIAQHQRIPQSFLPKLLQRACLRGLVRSHKGTGGGYELGLPPDKISLLAIVHCMDGKDSLNRCILEDRYCPNGKNCALHESWSCIRCQMVDLLKAMTLADMVRARRARPGKGRKKSPAEVGHEPEAQWV